MIVDSALKLLTAFLQLVKKMSLKDGILVVLVLATVSFAWASNSYRNDAIEATLTYENYRIEIQEQKYDKQLDKLRIEKDKLKKKIIKLNKEKQYHINKSKELKNKFDEIINSKPDKAKIKKEVDKLNGAKKVCGEISRRGINCFIYSPDNK